jgi:ribosomal protein S10
MLNKSKLLDIHIFLYIDAWLGFPQTWNLNQRMLKNYAFLQIITLLQFWKTQRVKLMQLTTNIYLRNTDYSLVKRDYIFVRLIVQQLTYKVKNVNLFLKRKKFNVLRSPFVNNKSREHFEQSTSCLQIKSTKITSILLVSRIYFVTSCSFKFSLLTLKNKIH